MTVELIYLGDTKGLTTEMCRQAKEQLFLTAVQVLHRRKYLGPHISVVSCASLAAAAKRGHFGVENQVRRPKETSLEKIWYK